MSGTQPVDVDDLRSLIIYSVRYAMGRQSYAPSEVQAIARKHRSVMRPHELRRMAYDIDTRGFLGSRDDHAEWRAFASWCVAEADREEA
jgi:hypothetical protein